MKDCSRSFRRVCVCVTVFMYLCGDQNVKVYCACGDQRPFWGQNPNSYEFEDVSESQCGFSVRVRIRRSF